MGQSNLDRNSPESPPGDFASLPRIASGRYSDPEFLLLEKECLWQRSWLYACHADELPTAGSFVTWEKGESPIVLVRGNDDQVRAFYNVCQHRGGPLVKDTSGQLSGSFVCAFHGWRYDFEGSLHGVPDRRGFGDLELSCHHLGSVRCENIGNWIFVNEDPHAESLLSYLGPIADQWQQFDPQHSRHVATRSYDVACNCKTMLEAFLEVYHLRSVHRETVDRFLEYRMSQHVLLPSGHSLMLTPNRDGWQDPGTKGLPEFPSATSLSGNVNVSYNVYPNLITPVSPTGIPFLVFWPSDDASVQIDCHWFSPDWGDGEIHTLWNQRMQNFERILEEDLELAPYLQKALSSRGFEGSVLSYQERRIYHWHEELDRRIGSGRVPAHLRVEPRLEKLIDQHA